MGYYRLQIINRRKYIEFREASCHHRRVGSLRQT